MRRCTVLVIAIALLMPIVGSAHNGPWGQLHPRPPWLPKVWWAIGMCETHLNWRWNSGSYQGAFGFYRGTWDGYKPRGYPADAFAATPRQQYVVAQRVAARHTKNAWGCYRNGTYLVWLRRLR